jgi:hypothetical protein
VRGLAPEKIRHDQDLQNIKWLMSSIHLPTLDDLIERLPQSVPGKALWFWENFRGVVENSLFHLHDPAMADAVDRLFKSWSTATSHGEQYHDAPGGHLYIFSNRMDAPIVGERKQAWDEIEAARPEMRSALDGILARLREAYVTINIRKTNLKAWRSYEDDTAEDQPPDKISEQESDKTKKGRKKTAKDDKKRKAKHRE